MIIEFFLSILVVITDSCARTVQSSPPLIMIPTSSEIPPITPSTPPPSSSTPPPTTPAWNPTSQAPITPVPTTPFPTTPEPTTPESTTELITTTPTPTTPTTTMPTTTPRCCEYPIDGSNNGRVFPDNARNNTESLCGGTVILTCDNASAQMVALGIMNMPYANMTGTTANFTISCNVSNLRWRVAEDPAMTFLNATCAYFVGGVWQYAGLSQG